MAKKMSKREQQAYLVRALADARADRKVGDAVLSYDLQSESTIVRIEEQLHGKIVYLANGDSMHISRVKSPGYKP